MPKNKDFFPKLPGHALTWRQVVPFSVAWLAIIGVLVGVGLWATEGDMSMASTEDLLSDLESPHVETRLQALKARPQALIRNGQPASDDVIPALLNVLVHDPNDDVAREVEFLLLRLDEGPVDDLIMLLTHERKMARDRARGLLLVVFHRHPTVLEGLIGQIKSGIINEHIVFLLTTQMASAPAIPAAVDLIKKEATSDPEAAKLATELLTEAGEAARPALEELASHPSADVRAFGRGGIRIWDILNNEDHR